MPALVIAHQGGWDEFLFVVFPLTLFIMIVGIARLRASAKASENTAKDEADTSVETMNAISKKS
ncbi:MAG: hypothetical protein OXI96_10835 [Acidimicrobiaceae bacterium]|nr:hypothetical protein [Acidimicrobiaceae bacterium]